MRMLQPSGEANFPLEALHVHARRQLFRENLEDYLSLQSNIFRDEDATHPPTKLAFDQVGGAEGRLETVAELRHGALSYYEVARCATFPFSNAQGLGRLETPPCDGA